MTNPPTSWTDGYGDVHAGPPPTGYWIASDDRWYAPELHPDYAPTAPEPATFEPTFEPATFETATSEPVFEPATLWEPPRPEIQPDAPASDDDATAAAPPNRTVIGAVVGLVVALGIVAGVYTMTTRGDDRAVIAGETPTTATAADTPTDTPNTTVEAQATPGALREVSQVNDLAGIERCFRIDHQTLEISMVNLADTTASYLLTIAYLDADGVRVGDDNVYIASLRPGERTSEPLYVFSDAGVGCEVVAADRYDRNGAEALGDISACTIREANANGFIEADIAATNRGTTDVDYTVEVAFVDATDVRRGYGTAYVERTTPGATTPGQVFTTLTHDGTYRCEVVAVTRFESAQ